MKNEKKAIILDMDETLEHKIYKSMDNSDKDEEIMMLRPNLDKLIKKLNEAKLKGIDIILCTSADSKWVERFLSLKPQFKSIFNKMYTRDNEEQWRNYSKEENPVEYHASQINPNIRNAKPITTFGYDSILFIDDSRENVSVLRKLFELQLNKDVTYFSGFGFAEGIDFKNMLTYLKFAKQDILVSKKLKEYVDIAKNNPGCHMMCKAIDRFYDKEFQNGLTVLDDEFSTEYYEFIHKLESIEKDLYIMVQDLKKNRKITESEER